MTTTGRIGGAMALVFALGESAFAQGVGSGVAGRVVDARNGMGIAGADVAIGGVRTTTDDDGAFRLVIARTGGDTLRSRRLGYQPMAIALDRRTDLTTVRVALAAIPQHLSGVVVKAERTKFSGRLAGFYERLERRTSGQFITRADIDREKPRQLTHLLQHAPGIQASRGRGGTTAIRMRGRTCWPLVWLDGVAMPAGEVDLDSFSPTSIHGIELYLGSASAPLRFQASRGNSSCGSIVLWSRGPDTDPVGRRRSASPVELERLIASASVFTADQVDTAAVPTSNVVVPYPALLRATKVSGSVVAEFVVSERGRIEEESYGVVTASAPEFAEAVRQALMTVTYQPAMRRGQAVRQLVRQTFEFSTVSEERERAH